MYYFKVKRPRYFHQELGSLGSNSKLEVSVKTTKQPTQIVHIKVSIMNLVHCEGDFKMVATFPVSVSRKASCVLNYH